MITVLQLTFLETWNLFNVRGMRKLLIRLIQMFTYSKSYLKKHRTLNMSLVIANDGHWLGLERNEIKKTLANRRQGTEDIFVVDIVKQSEKMTSMYNRIVLSSFGNHFPICLEICRTCIL